MDAQADQVPKRDRFLLSRPDGPTCPPPQFGIAAWGPVVGNGWHPNGTGCGVHGYARHPRPGERILLFYCYIEITIVGFSRLLVLGAAPPPSGWPATAGLLVGRGCPFPSGEWRGKSCGGGLNDRHRHRHHGYPWYAGGQWRVMSQIVRRFHAYDRCVPGGGVGPDRLTDFGVIASINATSGERQFRFEALGHETVRTVGDRVRGVDGEPAYSTSTTWARARC